MGYMTSPYPLHQAAQLPQFYQMHVQGTVNVYGRNAPDDNIGLNQLNIDDYQIPCRENTNNDESAPDCDRQQKQPVLKVNQNRRPPQRHRNHNNQRSGNNQFEALYTPYYAATPDNVLPKRSYYKFLMKTSIIEGTPTANRNIRPPTTNLKNSKFFNDFLAMTRGELKAPLTVTVTKGVDTKVTETYFLQPDSFLSCNPLTGSVTFMVYDQPWKEKRDKCGMTDSLSGRRTMRIDPEFPYYTRQLKLQGHNLTHHAQIHGCYEPGEHSIDDGKDKVTITISEYCEHILAYIKAKDFPKGVLNFDYKCVQKIIKGILKGLQILHMNGCGKLK